MPFRVFRKPDDLSFARLISFPRSFIIYPSIPIIGMCSNCSTWSIISPIWNFEMENISKRQQFLFYATRTWFFVPLNFRLPPNFVVSNLASIRTFTLRDLLSNARKNFHIRGRKLCGFIVVFARRAEEKNNWQQWFRGSSAAGWSSEKGKNNSLGVIIGGTRACSPFVSLNRRRKCRTRD